VNRRRVGGAARLLLLVALLAGGTGAPARAEGLRLDWRDWSREAFDEARATNRLVLLDITTTWCHSCRVMAESTYTDPLVVATILGGYVPIHVDHDLRPDIGDRYLGSGWPTTAILSPEGHLLASTTILPAKGMREFLAQGNRFYRLNRSLIDRKVQEAERSVAHTWDPDTLSAPTVSDAEYIQMNIDALRDVEDTTHGGFGTAPKTARWDAISFLLRAADARRDDQVRALAVRSAAAALALQDSVDGGFFRVALESDWSRPRYERLLSEQASAIEALTRVWRATGEARFRDAVMRARGFLESSGLAVGSFSGGKRAYRRASVGPDARRKDGSWVEGGVYFGLSRAARSKLPPLPVSNYVLADATAKMCSAEIQAIRYFQPDPKARTAEVGFQMAALGRLARSLGNPDGSYDHAEDGARRWGTGLLADQAAMGLALLDVFEDQGFPAHLEAAERLAAWMSENLEDRTGGGFRYAPRDSAAVGRLKAGDKPESANVDAATFFLRLYWLTGNEAYRRTAQRTSDYLRSGPTLTLDPARAELVLRLQSEPVRLVVVRAARPAEGDSGREWALRSAALRAPAPAVVVRTVSPPATSTGELSWPLGLPKEARAPAVYRWTRTGWRGPVTDPEKIPTLLDKPNAAE